MFKVNVCQKKIDEYIAFMYYRNNKMIPKPPIYPKRDQSPNVKHRFSKIRRPFQKTLSINLSEKSLCEFILI